MSIFSFNKKAQERKVLQNFLAYQNEIKPIAEKYYSQMERIQADWSVMYNLKTFSGNRADKFQRDCIANIQLYKKMSAIDRKYGELTPPSAPAFKRLAMLYEKQGEFEKSISVCADALLSGAHGENMKGRLARMIKKAGREPTNSELALMDI